MGAETEGEELGLKDCAGGGEGWVGGRGGEGASEGAVGAGPVSSTDVRDDFRAGKVEGNGHCGGRV